MKNYNHDLRDVLSNMLFLYLVWRSRGNYHLWQKPSITLLLHYVWESCISEKNTQNIFLSNVVYDIYILRKQ